VTSARSISKTICAFIAVQETTSWTSVPRSRPLSLLRAAVLQQLLPRNSQKNKERSPGFCTD